MTEPDVLPRLAQRCWGGMEVVHIVGYFAAEPAAEYAELGLKARAGYFAARSAAMGAASPELTIATFYVFSPGLVRHAMAGLWERLTPAEVLVARHRGVVAALRRLLGDVDVSEAAELARTACQGLAPQGRALYAAHAALPWPDEPMLGLWHAAALLREHRGDGHVAALLLAGLDPVESIIVGGLTSGMTTFMQQSRGFSAAEWEAGEDRLRGRGLLDAAGALTDAGTALHASIEAQTRAAALAGWQHLGADSSARLLELVTPLRTAILDSDLLPPDLRAARSR